MIRIDSASANVEPVVRRGGLRDNLEQTLNNWTWRGIDGETYDSYARSELLSNTHNFHARRDSGPLLSLVLKDVRVRSQGVEELVVRLSKSHLGNLHQEVSVRLLGTASVGCSHEDDTGRTRKYGAQGRVPVMIVVIVRLDKRCLYNQAPEAVADEDNRSCLVGLTSVLAHVEEWRNIPFPLAVVPDH